MTCLSPPVVVVARRAVLAAALCAACLGSPPARAQQAKAAPPVQLLVLATADEHGWLEPLTEKGAHTYQGGMAYLAGQFTTREAYRASEMLLLSAGDMWTGPFESTILQGRPMLQIMNSMGYDGAAIGNHEFDFGQDVLRRRATESAFPFLSANVYKRGTRVAPPFARPFAITTAAGLKVGLVGLTTTDTVYTTDVRNLSGLQFGPYAQALARTVPQARAAGAQLVVVVAHADLTEMVPLAAQFRALGVNLVICGHRHRGGTKVDAGRAASTVDDVVFCNPGPYGRSYCRVALTLDGNTLALRGHKVSVEPVAGRLASPTYPPVEGIMAVAADARSQANVKGAESLGALPVVFHRKEPVPTFPYLVVDSWLKSVPKAEFAITNRGGFRQDLPAGDLTVRDLVGAMPFDNYLVVVALTGEQIREALENPQSIPGGLTADVTVDVLGKRMVHSVRDSAGKPLDPLRQYRVVINDFMYRGGDHYAFNKQDPQPEETGLHWREPLLRALRDARDSKTSVVAATRPRFVLMP